MRDRGGNSRRPATAWVAGALFAIGSAFTPPPLSARQAQTPEQPGASNRKEITMIGCLVRVDTSARRPGTSDPVPSGHPGQPQSSGYALKDAAEWTRAEPAKGPVATRSERELGIARGDVSVERFAGHQVEIKGRLTSTTAASSPAPDAKRLPPGHDAMIDVTAIRSISDSCPPRG